MLSAIQLNDEHRLQTYKIEDVVFEGMLPAKFQVSDLFAAQTTPEKFLCVSWILAKAALQFWLNDVLVGLAFHCAVLLVPIPTLALPLKGREHNPSPSRPSP